MTSIQSGHEPASRDRAIRPERGGMAYHIGPSRLARYFYHNCERYLRYQSTPMRRQAIEGVPPRDADRSPVTHSLLEAGFAWEEQVVYGLGALAWVPAGSGRMRDRAWPVEETLRRAQRLPPGHYLYQGQVSVPASFYSRYGLTESLTHFPDCKPDLIYRDPQGRLTVVDVKATEMLKSSHRIQVGLYALILREHLGEEVNLDQGGVWLSQQPQPEWFDLRQTLPVLETFLRDQLTPIFREPVGELPWHLVYRCEWCEYYRHCRDQAEQMGSVSLLPYLSQGGRDFLRLEGVNTLSEFQEYLQRQPERLEACGCLRGKARRWRQRTQALLQNQVEDYGGSCLALPVHEQVRIVVTLQKEPVSGRLYAAGLYRYQRGQREAWVRCATSLAETAEVERELLHRLHGHLSQVDAYNRGRDWEQQWTLQTYVFDTFERDYLQELLLRALEDPQEAPAAMQLLFHFQSEDLARWDEHPRREVPFPVVALTEIIGQLVALPFPLAVRLDEALLALRASTFSYQTPEYLSFELSNALRQDAVLRTWSGADDYGDWIEKTLKHRMVSASVVLDGLRRRLQQPPFAWPPRFQFVDSEPYRHPELSKLAFVARYECLLGALAQRARRAAPWSERVLLAVSLPLELVEADRWRVLTPVDSALLGVSPMLDRLLVPEGHEGERDQMCYDDFRNRANSYAPSHTCVRLARLVEAEERPEDGTLKSVRLEIRQATAQSAFVPGQRAVLHPRFIDYNTDKLLSSLRGLDARGETDFLRLLRGQLNDQPPTVPLGGQPPATAALTSSQRRAFEHVAGHRLTLVWGPPGTGKTHFLTQAMAAWVPREQGGSRPEVSGLRVVVTAFTHAAIDHLLKKLGEQGIPTAKLVAQPQKPPEIMAEQARQLPAGVVLGGTVYRLHHARKKGLRPADVLIIDEGSQMKLGEAALALDMLAPGGRLVVAGDHRQLPPIIQGRYPEPEEGTGLQDSVFAYLQDRYPVCQLTENWRMNETLTRFPAQTLYGQDYRPARPEVAARRLALRGDSPDELCQWLLDPDFPLALCLLENVQAAVENLVEAQLVARLAVDLRRRGPWEDDTSFWTRGLFVVSPYHLQIRAIRRCLSRQRSWSHTPFVDTVDKMQGQESQAVLVSYGVSDPETALAAADFLYSVNRLNVSLTRAQAKCVVCLPQPILKPSFDLLAHRRASEGLGFMHALLEFCRASGQSRQVVIDGSPATLWRTR